MYEIADAISESPELSAAYLQYIVDATLEQRLGTIGVGHVLENLRALQVTEGNFWVTWINRNHIFSAIVYPHKSRIRHTSLSHVTLRLAIEGINQFLNINPHSSHDSVEITYRGND